MSLPLAKQVVPLDCASVVGGNIAVQAGDDIHIVSHMGKGAVGVEEGVAVIGGTRGFSKHQASSESGELPVSLRYIGMPLVKMM